MRELLQESCTIHRYEFPGSAKTGKHSTDCWCGNGDYTPKEPKQREPVKREQKTRDPELIAEIRRRKETGQLLDRDQLIEQFGGSAGTINSAQSWVEGEMAGEEKVRAEQAAAVANPPSDAVCNCSCPVHCV